jgi:hypothetical protein
MKTLNQLLETPQSDLQQILQKAQQIQRLQHFLEPFLPAPIRSECTVANYHVSQLKILASNASVATTLRFLIPQLLQHLQSKPHWRFLQEIVILIQKRAPLEQVSIETEKNQLKRAIPEEAIQGFLWLANEEDDTELRQVLEQLGNPIKK